MSAKTVTVSVPMPRLSDSMQEGTVLAWHRSAGETVKRGDALVEIETDKATMVYEAETDGRVLELLVAEGQTAAVGDSIARIEVDRAAAAVWGPVDSSPGQAHGEDDQSGRAGGVTADPGEPPQPSGHTVVLPAGAEDRRRPSGRPNASPLARRLAKEHGIDLASIVGSGPGGRIVRADVLGAIAEPPAAGDEGGSAAAAAVAPDGRGHAAEGEADEHLTLSATQRTIARRMVASRSEVPEFTLTAEIDMTSALDVQRQLREMPKQGTRVSVNDLVVAAVSRVLREQPRLNASWQDDHVVRHGRVHVGIAVAADDALLVPVIRDADRRGVAEIAQAARAAGARARARSLGAEELQGATFTVTNLGMFGVLSFDAVIDAPQVAILAVGAVVRRPAFDEHGAVVARDLMQVSLSCDHRAVYGAEAARFLQRLRETLERAPASLLMPA